MTMDLATRVREATEHALEVGALTSIDSQIETLPDRGVDFAVRLAPQLREKTRDRRGRAADGDGPTDPFQPYDEDLFVSELSRTHVCLLNKYRVLDEHVLVVTREFEEQRAPLTESDFEAWWRCLDGLEGLGFFNGGPDAGASERHKHMQVASFPIGAEGIDVPIAVAFEGAVPASGSIGTSQSLSFPHRLARLPADASVAERTHRSASLYREMLGDLGISLEAPTDPYNLLVTREWMLVVPRSRECFDSISINALGFAGAFLATNEGQLERIREVGPMEMLSSVT